MSIARSLEIATSKVNGRTAYLLSDRATKIEYERNSSEQFRAASLIKLPILWTYLIEVAENKINPQMQFAITSSSKVLGTGVLKDLDCGNKFTLEELATIMITESDNIATNILIDILGFDLINSQIITLGMKSTHLQRKMQDFDSASQGRDNLTTAKDIAIFLHTVIDGVSINDNISLAAYKILKSQNLNSKLPKFIPDDIEIAHKTGDLPKLEHDVGILSRDNRKIIVVALADDLIDNTEGVEYCQQVGKIAATLMAT